MLDSTRKCFTPRSPLFLLLSTADNPPAQVECSPPKKKTDSICLHIAKCHRTTLVPLPLMPAKWGGSLSQPPEARQGPWLPPHPAAGHRPPRHHGVGRDHSEERMSTHTPAQVGLKDPQPPGGDGGTPPQPRRVRGNQPHRGCR